MFGNKTKVQMTEDEKTILILALNELRNKLLSEGRFTDAVNELTGHRPDKNRKEHRDKRPEEKRG